MFKKILLSAAAATVVALSACSSFEAASTLNGQKLVLNDNQESMAHVYANIWGIYIFGLPIMTGSCQESGKCALFSDNVNVNSAVNLLTRCSNSQLNSKYIVDVASQKYTLPLLISYKSVEASGNAIK